MARQQVVPEVLQTPVGGFLRHGQRLCRHGKAGLDGSCYCVDDRWSDARRGSEPDILCRVGDPHGLEGGVPGWPYVAAVKIDRGTSESDVAQGRRVPATLGER